MLRRAVADAETLADGALTARALTALGSALVHAGRGSDEEGVTALYGALVQDDADPGTLAAARCELAYVEFLRGRYDRVEPWLREVDGAAPPAQRAAALAVRGSTLSDRGRYAQALAALAGAYDAAPDDRRRAYVASMTGRVHLLRGDLDVAAGALDESMDLAAAAGWATFVPWPEALRAEVDLSRGDVGAAAGRLEHAFALGCQIGDPCWEGVAGRGLGLVQAARGDVGAAVLTSARRGAPRHPAARRLHVGPRLHPRRARGPGRRARAAGGLGLGR